MSLMRGDNDKKYLCKGCGKEVGVECFNAAAHESEMIFDAVNKQRCVSKILVVKTNDESLQRWCAIYQDGVLKYAGDQDGLRAILHSLLGVNPIYGCFPADFIGDLVDRDQLVSANLPQTVEALEAIREDSGRALKESALNAKIKMLKESLAAAQAERDVLLGVEQDDQTSEGDTSARLAID